MVLNFILSWSLCGPWPVLGTFLMSCHLYISYDVSTFRNEFRASFSDAKLDTALFASNESDRGGQDWSHPEMSQMPS